MTRAKNLQQPKHLRPHNLCDNSKYADITPSSNYWHYKNPKVDELLDRGMSTLDPAARKVIYG